MTAGDRVSFMDSRWHWNRGTVTSVVSDEWVRVLPDYRRGKTPSAARPAVGPVLIERRRLRLLRGQRGETSR